MGEEKTENKNKREIDMYMHCLNGTDNLRLTDRCTVFRFTMVEGRAGRNQ
jgi:hypothetical protein